ncbi:MAG: hypothetical protein H6Q55_3144 [Deltaproteobacteria bacterium]|jgi:SAM-dependent methyltransferase|nr:hypothetical protein [Deltaproteobacteria bacterium]
MRRIATYNIKAILEGGLSLLPGCGRFFRKRTGGTDSARYCYAVWLRHLVMTQRFRKSAGGCLGTVVELGPGDSLGTGLAALLCGASRYIAVDVIRHANAYQNVKVFENLVSLFADRASLPSDKEFSEVKPLMDDLSFPSSVLGDGSMEKNLHPKRLQTIADGLRGTSRGSPLFQYVDPVAALSVVPSGTVDMVFSQAALEHVEDLEALYQTCRAWLKPGGLMSHQIDLRSHGTSREWNGHWVYPDRVWRLIRGKRPYLLNREPCSTHLRLLTENGFQIAVEKRYPLSSRLHRSQLAPRFRKMPEQDLSTAGLYVVAQKIKT